MDEAPSPFSIPAEYVRHIGAQLAAMDVDVDRWLGASGLVPGALAAPDRLLPAGVFKKLVRDALTLSREPALGLFVGERLVASSHGIVGAVAVSSSTVGQALDMVERFSTLRTSLFVISHRIEPTPARVCFEATQPLDDIERPMLEAVMLSIKNVLDEITMGACPLEAVVFPFDAPDYAALASDIFGTPVRYAAGWAGFIADPALLQAPLRMANPTAFEVAAQICQRELDRLTEDEGLTTKVRRALLQRQNGFPSLQVIARTFHMTPRTLHRRLVQEGTSYRALIESVRHTLAVEQLKSDSFGLDEIAYRLGYTDLSNFRRAFKRWQGVAPSEFRAQLLARRGAR